jgi:hypothetical protein
MMAAAGSAAASRAFLRAQAIHCSALLAPRPYLTRRRWRGPGGNSETTGMADLPDGRRRLRWDEEIPDACPACGRPWAEHPGSIEFLAVDGHAGRVLPQCDAPPGNRPPRG